MEGSIKLLRPLRPEQQIELKFSRRGSLVLDRAGSTVYIHIAGLEHRKMWPVRARLNKTSLKYLKGGYRFDPALHWLAVGVISVRLSGDDALIYDANRPAGKVKTPALIHAIEELTPKASSVKDRIVPLSKEEKILLAKKCIEVRGCRWCGAKPGEPCVPANGLEPPFDTHEGRFPAGVELKVLAGMSSGEIARLRP